MRLVSGTLLLSYRVLNQSGRRTYFNSPGFAGGVLSVITCCGRTFNHLIFDRDGVMQRMFKAEKGGR